MDICLLTLWVFAIISVAAVDSLSSFLQIYKSHHKLWFQVGCSLKKEKTRFTHEKKVYEHSLIDFDEIYLATGFFGELRVREIWTEK